MSRALLRDRDVKRGPVPADVLAYWRAKSLRVSFAYQDVWREEHDLAFTVAKVMRRDVLAALQEELDSAIQLGTPAAQWIRDVEPRLREMGWWERQEVVDPQTGKTAKVNPPARLRQIFDTNLRVARAVGQWDRIQRTKKSRPFLLYVHGTSARPRPQHLAWHGLLLPVDDPFWAFAMPPNGFGCFLPNTRITGAIIGASKARYSGQAVEIKTESGASLAVTPNHPIATARGWVRAGDLQPGDHCISHRGEVKLVRNASGPHAPGRAVRNQQIPAIVQDVFETFSPHRRRSAQVTALDFHGEAKRFVGQVEVVGSYVQLVHQLNAQRAYVLGQDALALAYPGLTLVDGPREPFALNRHAFPARAGLPGSRTGPHDGRAVGALPPLQASLYGSANVDSTTLQKASDSGPAYATFVRELQDRTAGKVALDKIISVSRFPYCGHVYDLESESGWILAGGVVASNCSCSVRSVSKREAESIESIPLQEPELDDDGQPTGRGVERQVEVRRTAPDVQLVPWENKRTGRIELVRDGIDPGFDKLPGEGRQQWADAAEED